MVICEMTFWIAFGSSRYLSIKINALKLFKSTQRIAIPLLIHWASNPCFVSIIHKLIAACTCGRVEVIFWFTGCLSGEALSCSSEGYSNITQGFHVAASSSVGDRYVNEMNN